MVNYSNPLTREQRAFAEEHHGVIYTFLRTSRLPEVDFYDVAVFGYLNAVRKYMERQELQAYAFTTIAFWSMRTAINNERKKATRRPATLSLDAEDDNGFSLYGIIPDEALASAEEDPIISRQYIDLLNILTEPQRTVLTMKASGYTAREIAGILGYSSTSAVDNIAFKGRKAIRDAEQRRTGRHRPQAAHRCPAQPPL